MNHEEKSPDLEQLKQLLAKSYDGAEGDDVPPMPEGLRDRIADQYGRSATTPSREAEAGRVSLFATIAQLFATPSMRAVAAVVILLLVATVVITKGPDSTTGTVRGGGGDPSSLTCILYQLDEAERTAVTASGLDGEALKTAADAGALQAALEAQGARIVLDGEADKILGYLPGASEPAIEEPLPADPAALTAKIAEITAELTK